MKNKNIAVTIQNMVQYYSITYGIDALIKHGYNVDIYIPIQKQNDGYNDMFNNVYDKLKGKNYNIYREYKGKKYKIVLSPYNMDIYYDFKTDYNLKYKYAAVAAKPKITYNLNHNYIYDAILCCSTWENKILKVYAPTFNVGNLKFVHFKKIKKQNKKQKILYLPTYGKYSSLKGAIEGFKRLKDKYIVITKMHHGTSYLKEEQEDIKKLYNVFDKVYDENTELTKLLEDVDLVISDNSGSVFEAMYARVPVLIYSEDEDLSINGLIPLQQQLVEQGVILRTNDIGLLPDFISKTFSNDIVKKQLKCSDDLFPIKNSDLIETFIKIIEIFINDDVDLCYYKLHDYVKNNITKFINNEYRLNYELERLKLFDEKIENLNHKINNLNKIIFDLEIENNNLKDKLKDYEKGKLYKLSKKIYFLSNKFRR